MPLKVDIYVNGCYHALHLASQLDRLSVLNQVMTIYPRSYCLKRYSISPDKLSSYTANFWLAYAFRKLNASFNLNLKPAYQLAKRFDSVTERLLSRSAPDIVTCFSSSAVKTLQLAKQKEVVSVLESGSAHVLHNREILSSEYQQNSSKRKYLSSEKMVQMQLKEYDLADYISVPSVYVKNSFLRFGIPQEKLIVTPYGIDTALFKNERSENDEFIVLFVGLVSVQKGVHYLLEAFNKLKLANAKLYLVGAVANDIKALLGQYANDNIISFGTVEQARLPEFYAKAALFCLPSLQDGFGMVALEAMASGLPVLVSENCGAADLVEPGENGYIVPVRDSDQLAEKIQYLYEHDDIARSLGNQAAKKVSEYYTWEQYGKKMLEHYQNIVS